MEVIQQRTRIAIMAQVGFGGCVVRTKWLLASLWLTRRAEHPPLRKVQEFGPGSYGHQFRLETPDDVEEALRGLVREGSTGWA